MEEILKYPAELVKVESKANNALKLVFATQEALNPQDAGILLSNMNKLGWLIFSPTQAITEVEIPKEHVEFKGDKTPSQRLRAVIYVYWEENTDKKIPFDSFYSDYVNKIIENIKTKLP